MQKTIEPCECVASRILTPILTPNSSKNNMNPGIQDLSNLNLLMT